MYIDPLVGTLFQVAVFLVLFLVTCGFPIIAVGIIGVIVVYFVRNGKNDSQPNSLTNQQM